MSIEQFANANLANHSFASGRKGLVTEKLAFDAGLETSHLSRIERGERRLAIDALDSLAAALGSSPAAVCAIREGLALPTGATGLDGDLTVDYTPEAVELRKAFRKLPMASRRLVVDFAQMLDKPSPG